MDENSAVPAGWYPDPGRTSQERWWDGSRWTEHLRSPDHTAAIPPHRPADASGSQGQVRPPLEPRCSWVRPVALGAFALLLLGGISAAVWTSLASGDVVEDARTETAAQDPALNPEAPQSAPVDGEDQGEAPGEDAEGNEAVEEEPEEPLPPEPAEDLLTPPPLPDRSLNVGYVLPETGMLAFIGPPMIAGVELAVEEINSSGGIGGFPVMLQRGDSAGDEAVANAAAGRLLDLGVDAIVGAAATGMTLAIIDQVTGAGVVQCSPSNTGPGLSTYLDGGFYFRTAPSDALQGPVLAEQIIADGHRTLAIAARDDDYGRGLLDSASAAFEARGGSVLLGSTYDANSGSFDAVVDDLLNAGADAYLLVSFAEGADIVRGLLAAGTATGTMYGADGIAGAAFAEEVDPSDPNVLDGMTFTSPAMQFSLDFEERLATFAPDLFDTLFAAQSYDCVNLIALSAAAAGSVDAAAVRARMIDVTVGENECRSFEECMEFVQAGESIAYQSAAGDPLAFREVREGSGEPSRGTYDVSRFIDGRFTLVDTLVGVAAG